MKKKAKVKATGRASRPEKAGSKKAKLIKMLEGDGATLDAICKKFGWQQHTTRALISTLGKTSKIESTRTEKGAYRIIQ
jgi:Protein of unknown function (DUF3489)